MKPDTVLELRKRWSRMNYGHWLPQDTVLASSDWLAYVQAMAHAVPGEVQTITWPQEEDVLWPFPDGVVLVFDHPLELAHTIISHDRPDGTIETMDPHVERQLAAGLVVGPWMETTAPVEDKDGRKGQVSVTVRPTAWIGAEPSDVITSYWLPGSQLHARMEGGISESSRLMLAILNALGHRLTSQTVIPGSRAERRRAERELPGLRLLQLASGASVSERKNGSTVEWSHRWLVRGHWRLQPHGPKRSLRKVIWIDPFIKGPQDKPFDERQTVWKA